MSGTEFDHLIGRPTGAAVIRVERAPVTAFAHSVTDAHPLYSHREAARAAGFGDIPVPPTFLFTAARNWCRWAEEQPEDPTGGVDPMAEILGALTATGGIVLHGEQEFIYHRPVVVGDVLRMDGRLRDVYRKQSGDAVMTFLVIDEVYTDPSGDPVATVTMNLIHRS